MRQLPSCVPQLLFSRFQRWGSQGPRPWPRATCRKVIPLKRKSKLPLCKQTLPKQKHGAEIESKVESRVACKNKHIHLTKHGHIFHASTSVASRLQLMHVVCLLSLVSSHTKPEETRLCIDFRTCHWQINKEG